MRRAKKFQAGWSLAGKKKAGWRCHRKALKGNSDGAINLLSSNNKRRRMNDSSIGKDPFLIDKSGGSYYTSLEIPVANKKWYDVQPTCDSWRVRVGETIAVACNDSTVPYMTGKKKSNKWFPYKTPWAPAQVLALYKTKHGDWKLKFRWFYWHNDLPKTLTKHIARERNQVMEHRTRDTYDIETALGPIYLNSSSTKNNDAAAAMIGDKDGMPQIYLTCQHAVVKKSKRETIISINDWKGGGVVPMSALERALSLLRATPELRNATIKAIQNESHQFSSEDDDDDDDETMEEEESEASEEDRSIESQQSNVAACQEKEPPKTPQSVVTDSSAGSSLVSSNDQPYYQRNTVSYYWRLQLMARKQDYAVRKGMQANQKWILQVGDLIAVEHAASSKPTKTKPWFPFQTPWSPAQVLALSYSETDGYRAHLRWLFRSKDFVDLDEASEELHRQFEHDGKSKVAAKIVYEYDSYSAEPLDSVLGRVILTSNGGPSRDFLTCVQGDDGIPQAPLICRSLVSDDGVTPINDWDMAHSSTAEQLRRGVTLCLEQDKDLLEETVAMMDDPVKRFEKLGTPPTSSCESSPSQDSSVTPMDDDEPMEDKVEQDDDVPEHEEKLSNRTSIRRSSRKRAAPGPSVEDDPSTCGKRRSRRQCVRGKSHTEAESTGHPTDTDGTVYGEQLDNTLGDFVKDGVKNCEQDPRTTHAAAASPASDADDDSHETNDDEEDERIFIPNGLRPFHEDTAALRSYYSEIEVLPPFKNYATPRPSDAKEKRWTVKLGDMVTVHYTQGVSSAESLGGNRFKVQYAIAEVVTIWKEHESADAMRKSKRKTAIASAQDGVRIEIRWFYRKNELPGSAKTTTASENAAKHVEYEEIFETDLMDQCEATSLLAPAKLHESATKLGLPETENGMPIVDFHCCRFWSIHRKSLMPISGMSGRIERGRMHSKYFGKGGVLKAALREFNGETIGAPERTKPIDTPKKWQPAFKRVIDNLGLSAASEDASVRGIQLTGRETEQEKIMTFLRSRISGGTDDETADESDGGNVSTNASLFVAGPPGTGKTASVHSVIARLRKEQAKGKIPAFQFVSLNGMEMRHPFEAYVKFWETISGPEKQKCPPEVAVAKLERHFAGRGVEDEKAGKRSKVVVLLLDEIDYLVTKKQTVLYNFFDWPRRTMENGNGPRLVVVGISNTLNLPSRLKPSVQSRLGNETCGYKSYNVKDMIAILRTKIQSDKSVGERLSLLLPQCLDSLFLTLVT